jgi:hypothetical protein
MIKGQIYMEEKYFDVYALFKMQCANGNVLEAYYPFMANIILENNMEEINEDLIKKVFEERYKINISVLFIRQVLGVGIENKSIVKKYGKYIADNAELKKYKIGKSDFNKSWNTLKSLFQKYYYSITQGSISDEIFDRLVFSLIDTHSIKFIIDSEWAGDDKVDDYEYYWYSFIKELPQINQKVFDFLAYLSASSTYREALFVSQPQEVKYENLNIYLDSPMIFALLGMDSVERCEAYQELLNEIKKKGCNIQILDNNFEEVQGIIERASNWASSSAYDISKANKVAKYFHDSGKSRADMIEYSEGLEDLLNELGIVVKETSYDTLSNSFQEDEEKLFEMVSKKYSEHNMSFSQEKEETIRCDVKSIIMIYRERKGKTFTRINTCTDLMLTINAALANVCKNYEQTRGSTTGHIPACVSADLFGSILWLNSPLESVEYQKKKILADCYSALRPNKALLRKYVESVETAWKTGEIDEKKYLFMRSHAVVSDALMNVTKGDYAKFNDNTYIDVYEEIQAIARKELTDEKNAHCLTQLELKSANENLEQKSNDVVRITNQFNEYKLQQERRNQERFDKKCLKFGTCVSWFICIIPYFFTVVIAEFIKAKYTNKLTIKNLIIIATIAVIAILVTVLRSHLVRLFTIIGHKILKED